MGAGDRSSTTVVVVITAGDAELEIGRVVCEPDLALVDALARLQLAARRGGCRIRLDERCAELDALLALVGLADALGLEVGGQSEEPEQLRAQEVVEPGDAPA